MLIDVDDEGVEHASVLEFAQRYIFANEAAVRSHHDGKAVMAWLRAREVTPEYEFNNKGGVIYDRQKVEPWLELKV